MLRKLHGIPKKTEQRQYEAIPDPLVSENYGNLIITHEFAVYVRHRGFQVRMCRKQDPESKGRIENVVKYVKRNFARHRIFISVDKLNEDCLAWLDRTGNALVHHTTKKIPAEVFALEKQHLCLYASSGYWYCPAYCFSREDTRQFRADRIISAELNPNIPCRPDISRKTLLNKPDEEGLDKTTIELEMTKKGVWLLESNPRFGPYIRHNEDGSGALTMEIPAQNINFYVNLIWQWGEEVRIVGPTEAKSYVRQKIEAMHVLYCSRRKRTSLTTFPPIP